MDVRLRRLAAWAPWWSAWAAFGLLSLAIVAPAYVNHDDAWYLYMGRVLLRGGVLYRDVVDTNPPLIVWLSLPPVWVADHLGWSVTALFKVWVYALVLGSVAACWTLARGIDGAVLARRLLMAAIVFALLPMARVIEFGQREHFVALLTLPYVLAAIAWEQRRSLGRRWAWLVGVAAGAGFAIKPHYAAAWVAVEGCLLLVSQRPGSWRRLEALVAAGTMGAYAVVVVLFVPEFVALVETVRQVYASAGTDTRILLQVIDLRFWLVGLASMLVLRLPRADRVVVSLLFCAWTGFLLGAMAQLKGWNYHLYPARVACVLFFVTLACAVVPALGTVIRGGMRSVAGAAVAVLLLWGGRYVVESRGPASADLVTPLVRLVEEHAPRGTLAVLSMRTGIYPAFPAVLYSHARWSLRHNALWFLPGLYAADLRTPGSSTSFRDPSQMGPAEKQFFEEVVVDLCRRPPDLLLVESPEPRAPGGRRGLDLLAYYGQDARFRTLFAGFRPLAATVGPLDGWQRMGPVSCRGGEERREADRPSAL